MNPSQEPAQSYDEAQPYDPPPAYPYGAPVEALDWAPPRPKRRSLRRTVLVTVSVTAAMAVAGAPLGLLWSWLAPAVPVINAGQNGIVVNDPSPEEYIAADGWFTLIGFVFGLLAAVLLWLVLRRDRGPGLLLGATLGGLAAALVMWEVGRLVGLSAWNDWQHSSTPGQTYDRPPDLHAHGALLVAGFAAVIVTTLLAGWSNDPDLDLPGAKPGYGHDLTGGHPDHGHDLQAGQPGYGQDLTGGHPDQGHDLPVGQPGYGQDLPGGQPGYGQDLPGSGHGLTDEVSSGSPAGPDPTAAPAPPAPWPADPPRG